MDLITDQIRASHTRSVLSFYRRKKLVVESKSQFSEEDKRLRAARIDYKRVILNQDRRKSIVEFENDPLGSFPSSPRTPQSARSNHDSKNKRWGPKRIIHKSKKKSKSRPFSSKLRNKSNKLEDKTPRPSTAPNNYNNSRLQIENSFLDDDSVSSTNISSRSHSSRSTTSRSQSASTASGRSQPPHGYSFSRRGSTAGIIGILNELDTNLSEEEYPHFMLIQDKTINSQENTPVKDEPILEENGEMNIERAQSAPATTILSRPKSATLHTKERSINRKRSHSLSSARANNTLVINLDLLKNNNNSIQLESADTFQTIEEDDYSKNNESVRVDGANRTARGDTESPSISSSSRIISATISRRPSAKSNHKRPSTSKSVNQITPRSFNNLLDVSYEGGPPSSPYDRSRIEMTHWKQRPKSAIYKKKKITMNLYKPIIIDQKIEEKKSQFISVKIQNNEDKELAKELEKRHIQRESFKFLETHSPLRSKEELNLSESSFVQLKNFIKEEELRNDIFKHDTFVPVFPKTQLNLYRLGSHNNAYDSYDTMDFISDKNMYSHFDRLLKKIKESKGGTRERGLMTKEFIRSLPSELGVDKNVALKSRIRESLKR